MLQVYLPIAEVSVNLLVMLGLGAAVGFLSGMFGVGGGFLLTPLLMFSGVAAPIAVATGANQIVATSVSGAVAQWRRGNIDFRMGNVLIVGGVGRRADRRGAAQTPAPGRSGGPDHLADLRRVSRRHRRLMLVESIRAIHRARAGKPARRGRASTA